MPDSVGGPVYAPAAGSVMERVHAPLPRTVDVAPPPAQPLRVVRPVCAQILRAWYDVRLHGPEHVPATGPVVLALGASTLGSGRTRSRWARRRRAPDE